MRSAVVALLISLTLMVSALPPRAAELGTKEEAVAMVKRVQAKIRKDGIEATFRAINAGSKEFVDRDLYAFMFEFNGMDRANAKTPSVVGTNIIDMKDQDGKFIAREMITVARGVGHGWCDYRWPNPTTKTVEDKSAYVERVPNTELLIGVGVYRNEQPNENTVGLISGSPHSDDTYLDIAWDMAEVLNDGDRLRILPIAGIGGPRNIRDVRYLRGVDIGLTQTSILNNFRHSNEWMGENENKIVYIAKLFNEEVHLVARTNITSITQLRGLKVNLDARGSGTSYSMRDIFKVLGIEIQEVSMPPAEAFEMVKSGQIAATALIAGKPAQSMSKLGSADGLHFVPVSYAQPVVSDYLPATLTHDDYPDMIAEGQSVDTIAVGVVLIAYNWPKTNVNRYQRVERFVEAFFSKIDEFNKPPHHPKWQEVNIAATLPGWTRFEAAQNWLDRMQTAEEQQNLQQTSDTRGQRSDAAALNALSDDPKLFQEFLRWKQRRRQAPIR
jgi:uncharacterized protein